MSGKYDQIDSEDPEEEGRAAGAGGTSEEGGEPAAASATPSQRLLGARTPAQRAQQHQEVEQELERLLS